MSEVPLQPPPLHVKVWVLAKGDAKGQDGPLSGVAILGVYSSAVRAATAKKDFLEGKP